MAHVDVGLHHEGIGAGPSIVDVVVGDDVAAAGRAHGERLVHVIDDVVLDQAVAGVVADGDAVGAATLDHVRGVVEVRVPNDDPEGSIDLHVRAAHAVPRPGRAVGAGSGNGARSEEHTSELQSQFHIVCRLLLEKKKKQTEARFSIKTNYYTTSNHTGKLDN